MRISEGSRVVDDAPPWTVTASGNRAVSAGTFGGQVLTGDHALIDARRIELATRIPGPAEVYLERPLNNLPRPPAQVFAGRDEALGQLIEALKVDGGAVVTQAVYGLGGIGKSELAVHYASAHRGDYQLMWWITAADAAQVDAGLAGLARRLCPVIAVAGSTQDMAGWAVGWLQAHAGWLLILDNVEEPADVEQLLGQLAPCGHIVLTTRRDVDWQQMAIPIRLDVLDPCSAARVIIARTSQDTAVDKDAAVGIAAELGYLPLALDQAAAYIIKQHITPYAYLDSLRQHPARMYAAAGGGGAQRTIARLWDLTISVIRNQNQTAARLLEIIACYAPDAIPRIMLGDTRLREDTDEALGLLASYSMITLTTQTVSIHRLLQAVILSQPANAASGACSVRDTALDWLNAVIPDDPDADVAGWPLLRALVPHAEALADRYPLGDQPELLAVMYNQIGMFLQSQGDYGRALALRKSALRIAEAALGPDHPSTAILLGNLASTYSAQGRAADALPLDERALAISEVALGPDHPSTAVLLGNLAATYRDLGRPSDALPLDERAFAISEAALGPDHPSTAVLLGNLAATYRDLKRPEDALPLVQRALAITEAALGPDHPSTATCLGNLAAIHHDLGRPGDALPLFERALAITEAALGPDHPSTATWLGHLAFTYRELRRLADALPLFERALAITETTLGPNHPCTLIRLGNLADTYRAVGRPVEALPLEERELALMEAMKRPDPSTGIQSGDPADICSTREPIDSLPMEKRELTFREAAKRPDPSTGIRQGNLAFTYRAQERAAGALPLEQRVRQYFAGPCDEVLNRVYGYLDGELDDIDCAKIRQHLDECGPCLREYGLQEAVKRVVLKHTGGNPPP